MARDVGGRFIAPAPAPTAFAVFTSTRHVTGLAVAPDGTLWAATMGGVLRRAPDGAWRKFTRLDGLPSHEARAAAVGPGGVTVTFPRHTARWDGERWHARSLPEDKPDAGKAGPPGARAASAVWQGQEYAATTAGFYRRAGGKWTAIPLPPSPGTHVSALLPRPDALVAALFGDGLWAWDGKAWKRPGPESPPQARDITALARQGDTLWLGTRREGVWRHDGKAWTQFLQPGEPYDHNAQSLALFDGSLFVGTLEDGLAVRSLDGWKRFAPPVLSHPAPRAMAVFRDRLYLRLADGRVDAFDGTAWARNVFPALPRREASFLFTDGPNLLLSQYSGWSLWDGRVWTHRVPHPDLQGVSTTVLLAAQGRIWVGTQGRGVIAADPDGGKARRHDERLGLPDDWITALAESGGLVWAGTFVGGAARWDGSRWQEIPELRGQNVTALLPDGSGGVWLATRAGLWRHDAQGRTLRLNDRLPLLETELQCLCADSGGLWVGGRTGLYFLPASDLAPDSPRP